MKDKSFALVPAVVAGAEALGLPFLRTLNLVEAPVIASLLRDQGDLAGARQLHERALAICEKIRSASIVIMQTPRGVGVEAMEPKPNHVGVGARRMVPQARRHLGWTHSADRHRGHGTQAAHRALALCRNGGTSRRCRNPARERSSRVKEQEFVGCNIADDDTGNATVLFFGAITPPRFRWVASRRGYASCMRHSGAGSPNGPTACNTESLKL